MSRTAPSTTAAFGSADDIVSLEVPQRESSPPQNAGQVSADLNVWMLVLWDRSTSIVLSITPPSCCSIYDYLIILVNKWVARFAPVLLVRIDVRSLFRFLCIHRKSGFTIVIDIFTLDGAFIWKVLTNCQITEITWPLLCNKQIKFIRFHRLIFGWWWSPSQHQWHRIRLRDEAYLKKLLDLRISPDNRDPVARVDLRVISNMMILIFFLASVQSST